MGDFVPGNVDQYQRAGPYLIKFRRQQRCIVFDPRLRHHIKGLRNLSIKGRASHRGGEMRFADSPFNTESLNL